MNSKIKTSLLHWRRGRGQRGRRRQRRRGRFARGGRRVRPRRPSSVPSRGNCVAQVQVRCSHTLRRPGPWSRQAACCQGNCCRLLQRSLPRWMGQRRQAAPLAGWKTTDGRSSVSPMGRRRSRAIPSSSPSLPMV